MSRHLIIAADVAAGATGRVDTLAINPGTNQEDDLVTLLDSNGVNMPAKDVKEFRFIQHAADRKVFSPPIVARNVIAYSVRTYSAAVASSSKITVANAAGSDGFVTFKFVRTGSYRPEFFKLSVQIASGAANTVAASAIKAAYEAAILPDWLNKTASVNSAEITFSASLRGDVAQSGNVWEDPTVHFELIIEESTVVTQTFTPSSVAAGFPGVGTYQEVVRFEKESQALTYGYHNRIMQPIAPPLTADPSETYDLITVVATKDGSTSPQIKGVDNLIEVTIAVPNSTYGDTAVGSGGTAGNLSSWIAALDDVMEVHDFSAIQPA